MSVTLIAYLPLIIIWFAIAELPKVILIYLACFAPLALAARSGMRSASQEQIHAAYSLDASHWQVIRHVILPSAMPEILVGMRIVIGVVAYLFDLLMRWVERRMVPWKGRA